MELIIGENGVELVHDEGNWNLKKGVGFSPGETLVAAVAACGTYVFEGLMKGSKVPHEIVKTLVDYENDESTRVKPVKKIVIDYYVKIEEEHRARAERLVELVPKNCPIMQSINPKIEVVENIHYL